MVAPIIVRNPRLEIAVLTGGTPGTFADVSDDVSQVALTPNVPTSTVQTFSGKYQSSGDVEWGGTATIVVNVDTADNWDPLVGEQVRCRVYDRDEFTWYRQFDSEILFNPGLGGPTQPGNARSFEMTLPITSAVTIVTPP